MPPIDVVASSEYKQLVCSIVRARKFHRNGLTLWRVLRACAWQIFDQDLSYCIPVPNDTPKSLRRWFNVPNGECGRVGDTLCRTHAYAHIVREPLRVVPLWDKAIYFLIIWSCFARKFVLLIRLEVRSIHSQAIEVRRDLIRHRFCLIWILFVHQSFEAEIICESGWI